MRKALLFSTLALLATCSAASAATFVTFDTYCNIFSVRKTPPGFVFKDVGCSTSIGIGAVVTVKNQGHTLILGAADPASPTYTQIYELSYPLVTGGTWSTSFTTDGVHYTSFLSGTYTVGTDAPAIRGQNSTTPSR